MPNQEIERKFLIKGEFKKFAPRKLQIKQGFLSTVPERTVRVRITDAEAFLTIKGIGNKNGMSRFEFEKKIELADAKDLLQICEPGIIIKTRYIIPIKANLSFEIDEFFGDNSGLVLAEIELPSEETSFEKPEWLGKEVTGDVRYYNAMLVKKPYTSW